MAEEKFAFETGEVAVAFRTMSSALGDAIISKKVFNAIVALVPNCKVDIFLLQGANPKLHSSFLFRLQEFESHLEFTKVLCRKRQQV